MTNIFFWNLDKKDLSDLVCEAAIHFSLDVIALIESGLDSNRMLNSLQSKVSPNYYLPVATTGRIQLFCRDTKLNFKEVYSGNRISIRQTVSENTDILIGFVHLVDKDNFDQMNQLVQAGLLVGEVNLVEKQQENPRTILIGDFNMNPFDQVMNIAGGINAMMTKQCVESGSRRVQNIDYAYFYNPMWNLLGDGTPGPPGTYYYSNSGKGHFGWNMLDQVLLRPSVIPLFNDVRILTKLGKTQLYTNMGRPNRRAASDHFPLLVTLR